MPFNNLSLIQYLNYIGGSLSSRSLIEGEEVLNAGHIIMIGKTDSGKDFINVCALCLQSSALNNEPHELQGTLLSKNGICVIQKMVCSCKAGSGGRCKHISAVLLKLTRCMMLKFRHDVFVHKLLSSKYLFLAYFFLFSLFFFFCFRENLEELEDVSKTELKCIWNKQKSDTKKKYEAIPVKDMPCLSDKIVEQNFLVDEEEILKFYNLNLPNSAISKHRKGRHDAVTASTDGNFNSVNINILNHCAQSILMMELSNFNINISDCCKAMMENIYISDPSDVMVLRQNSQEWLNCRKYRVTGSRCYELYTYKGANWEMKSLKYFWPKSFSNKYVKHGIKYEENAISAFMRITELKIHRCGMIVPHNNVWLGYSPDGIILNGDNPMALLEIKCPYAGISKSIQEVLNSCTYISMTDDQYSLKKNHKYYGQIQMGMAILNLRECYMGLYASFDDSIFIIRVPFDESFTSKMLNQIKLNFFNNMVHTLCLNM